jgi:hypothetical protein
LNEASSTCSIADPSLLNSFDQFFFFNQIRRWIMVGLLRLMLSRLLFWSLLVPAVQGHIASTPIHGNLETLNDNIAITDTVRYEGF